MSMIPGVDAVCRPLSWPAGVPRTAAPERSPFKATYSSTVKLLGAELVKLGAEGVVLMLDVPASRIRQDGGLKADARPASSAVVLAFEVTGVGPQVYAVDRYAHWHENLRAIALTLQALRAVARYGAVRRGEQYRGFAALGHDASVPAGEVVEAGVTTVDGAAAYLARWSGSVGAGEIVTNPAAYQAARKAAIRVIHPNGGSAPDPAAWRIASAAFRLLETHHKIG